VGDSSWRTVQAHPLLRAMAVQSTLHELMPGQMQSRGSCPPGMHVARRHQGGLGGHSGSPQCQGGRLAITHCCCSYLPTGDAAERRRRWDAVRDAFRDAWAKEFGGWPVDKNKNPWPGHHIHDLARGGDPIADENVIPARDDVHRRFTAAYEQCYKGGSQWSMPGPDKPYRD
jgi:hypothetical protein